MTEINPRALSMLRPDIAAEWHPTKNGNLTPDAITVGSGKKVYWLGQDCSHTWIDSITHRTSGRNCAICSGRQIQKGVNDLATLRPDIATEWHPTKNGNLTPDTVTVGSGKRVYWLGKNCSHTWIDSIAHRIIGRNCAVCSGKQIQKGVNDLATLYPDIAVEWHPTKNGNLTPDTITVGSGKKIYWLGEYCKHTWVDNIPHRAKGRGCGVCVGRQIEIGHNDLLTTHPHIAAEWHPTKNSSLTPQQVTAGTPKQVYWLGKDCSHTWMDTVNHRTAGRNCAVCRGLQIQLGYNDLLTTHPHIAAEWHPTKNSSLTPQQVTAGANKQAYWLGKKCQHTWTDSVAHRTAGRNCAVCHGKQIQKGVNDLATLYPDIAAEWHPTKNGNLTPDTVTVGSGKKFYWLGECEHEWRVSVSHRTRGTKCPTCSVSGFMPTVPSTFYFIYHPDMVARKVGITNSHTDRLDQWVKNGWEVLYSYSEQEGHNIQKLETLMLRWVRKDLGIKQELSNQDMNNMGGASETFSAYSISNIEVIKKIEELVATF